jgi:hypothetical protein
LNQDSASIDNTQSEGTDTPKSNNDAKSGKESLPSPIQMLELWDLGFRQAYQKLHLLLAALTAAIRCVDGRLQSLSGKGDLSFEL